jgi:nucleoside-diphosphate-sugar epimerase
MSEILVTGGTGTLGRVLVERSGSARRGTLCAS